MAEIKIIIFEGPMCCLGGLCGPAPDPILIDIQNTITELQKEFKDSVEIVRANMITNFKDFLDNWDVYQRITKEGLSALPITKVNGKIIAEGSYPNLEMLKSEVERIITNLVKEDSLKIDADKRR